VILIKRKAPGQISSLQVIALFGSGLIGKAIEHAIIRDQPQSLHSLSFDWFDPRLRSGDAKQLKEAIIGTAAQSGNISQIDVVWAAGKAGFGATAEELAAEMHPFEDVVELSEALAALVPNAKHRFHYMSSAGGLYEGQRFVERGAEPRPRRPYGEAKLIQENRVTGMQPEIVTMIYRLSSAYGFSGPNGRVGLISALIANAVKHSTSQIFGAADTLRDYVLSKDVGDFVADRINEIADQSQVNILASGKPSSMHEILDTVARVTGRRLYYQQSLSPSNAGHITFLRSALPRTWRPTDLETGIRQVARQLSSSFALGDASRPL